MYPDQNWHLQRQRPPLVWQKYQQALKNLDLVGLNLPWILQKRDIAYKTQFNYVELQWWRCPKNDICLDFSGLFPWQTRCHIAPMPFSLPFLSPPSLPTQPPSAKQPQPPKWGEIDAAITLTSMGKHLTKNWITVQLTFWKSFIKSLEIICVI